MKLAVITPWIPPHPQWWHRDWWWPFSTNICIWFWNKTQRILEKNRLRLGGRWTCDLSYHKLSATLVKTVNIISNILHLRESHHVSWMPHHFHVLFERTKGWLNCNVELFMSRAHIHLHMRKKWLTTYNMKRWSRMYLLECIFHNIPNVGQKFNTEISL